MQIIETTSSTVENRVERIDEESYVAEVLKRIDAEDTEGVMRPVYRISDRDVVFRTLNDAPRYPQGVFVAGAEYAGPIAYTPYGDENVEASIAGVRQYVEQNTTDAESAVVVVSNTPDSLLATAAHLTDDAEKAAYLKSLQIDVAERRYALPESRVIVDRLLAAISIGPKGEHSSLVDVDGWAVGLASLLDDPRAIEIVDAKYETFIADEPNKASQREQIKKALELSQEFNAEPIPLSELALVHSTAYPIERNEEGNIVLTAAGNVRNDRYPRASLHFTVNSRVFPHAQAADAWGDDQKLIVANLQHAIDQGGKLKVLDGVDSWATLNPGENMELPGAIIVSPDTEAAELISHTDGEVSFASRGEYSDEELQEIYLLAVQHGIPENTPREMLKEVALRLALELQGVPARYHDQPSASGHGMASDHLARRVWATAATHGMTSGTHFNYPESHAEHAIGMRMEKFTDATRVDSPSAAGDVRTLFSDTSLQMRRMAFANGYYATRLSHVKSIDDEWADMTDNGDGTFTL